MPLTPDDRHLLESIGQDVRELRQDTKALHDRITDHIQEDSRNNQELREALAHRQVEAERLIEQHKDQDHDGSAKCPAADRALLVHVELRHNWKKFLTFWGSIVVTVAAALEIIHYLFQGKF